MSRTQGYLPKASLYARRLKATVFKEFNSFLLLLLTLTFLVSVNWLSKLTIQRFFGLNSDGNTPLLNQTLSLNISSNTLWQINVAWLGVFIILVVVLVKLLSYHTTKSNQERRHFAPGVFPSTTSHAALLFYLILFGVALGWLSDAINLYLKDHWRTAVPALFALLAVFKIASFFMKGNAGRAAIVASFTFAIVCLLSCYSNDFYTSLVSALFLAYWFFDAVKQYAAPKSVNVGENHTLPTSRHLIVFLSALGQNRIGSSPNENERFPLLESEFQERLQTAFKVALREEQEEKTTELLPNIIKELHLPSKSQCADKAKKDFCIRVKKALREEDEEHEDVFNLQPKGASKRRNISAQEWFILIHCFLSAYKTMLTAGEPLAVLKDAGPLRLSQVIWLLDGLLGSRTNWQMPLVSIEHHLGFNSQPLALNQEGLTVSFITSRDKQTAGNRSDASASQIRYLRELLNFYSHPNFQRLLTGSPSGLTDDHPMSPIHQVAKFNPREQCFVYRYSQQNRVMGNVFYPLFDAPFNVEDGIDFESYDECLQALNGLAEASMLPHILTCIDFTGGKKVTSMAATMASTQSDMIAQYVTNEYHVKGYDLRYYDLEKLGG